MRTFVHRLAALAALGVLAIGAGRALAADVVRLEGTAWVLASLPGTTFVRDAGATLRFSEGRASGSDGCNRYTTAYEASGAALRFDARGAGTRMACPPGMQAAADAFAAALRDTRGWRLAARDLELVDDAGRVLATFSPQHTTLAGTSWRVTGYNNGRQALVSVAKGTSLSIAFGDAGRVAGSSGCNRFTGRFTQDGETLGIRGLSTTYRSCAGPEGVMEQERAFLRALLVATSARLEGDRAELRDADGSLAATLARTGR